jgi:hypothetical protein
MSKYQVTGYNYYMSWGIGICLGPVDELLTVFRNEDIVWSGNLVRPVSGGQETISIPGMGTMIFFFGTDDQVADSTVGTIIGDATLNTPYRGLCWAYFKDCFIGTYNRMPTMRFIVRKTPTQTFSANNRIGDYNYNPAHSLWYILNTMAGLPTTWLDETGFAALASTLSTEIRGISICFAEQKTALDYVGSVNTHIDGLLRYGGDGKFHPKLLRYDYTAASLPLIDEDVYMESPTFERGSWIDTQNELKIQYSEITKTDNVWYINGSRWGGSVVTVGTGDYDFDNITDALTDLAGESALLLIYDGDYSDEDIYPTQNGQALYVRGMGTSYSDVIVRRAAQSTYTSCIMILEWVTIKAASGNGCIEPNVSGCSFHVNKCALIPLPFGFLVFTNQQPITPTLLKFTYCLLDPGLYDWDFYAWNDNLSVATTYMSRVWRTCGPIYCGWSLYGCVGSFAQDDTSYTFKEADAPDGYGPDEGSFIISAVAMSRGGVDIKQSTASPIGLDIGNKNIQNRIVSRTLQLPLFTTNACAVWAGRQILLKLSYPFANVGFKATREAFLYEVGDNFLFSCLTYGITNMVCRVVRITEEGPESEEINIEAVEDWFSGANLVTEYEVPTFYNLLPEQYIVLPLQNQRIIEAPYALISSEINLIPLASRRLAGDLGYNIYMSVDGGVSYNSLGVAGAFQPFGLLTYAYPENTFSIDDTVGITIDFEQDQTLVETVPWADVFAGTKNLALLGDEIISFQSVTPITATQYKLEGIIRGRYDTVREDHPAGEEFYVLQSNELTLLTNPEIISGATRKFKFVPFNAREEGEIVDATVITLAIAGRMYTPYKPTNFLANGGDFNARYSGDIVLTWNARYRGKGAGLGIPGVVLAESDYEGYFSVDVYIDAVLHRQVTDIDALTWTYTAAMNASDTGGDLAPSVTFRLFNFRLENGVTFTSPYSEVTCKKS